MWGLGARVDGQGPSFCRRGGGAQLSSGESTSLNVPLSINQFLLSVKKNWRSVYTSFPGDGRSTFPTSPDPAGQGQRKRANSLLGRGHIGGGETAIDVVSIQSCRR